jgi:hypothetical protein
VLGICSLSYEVSHTTNSCGSRPLAQNRFPPVIIWTKAAAAFLKTFVQMVLVCIHPPGRNKRCPRLSALKGASSADFAKVFIGPYGKHGAFSPLKAVMYVLL